MFIIDLNYEFLNCCINARTSDIHDESVETLQLVTILPRPCNFNPLNLTFIKVVILGFIIFSINMDCGYSFESPQ